MKKWKKTKQFNLQLSNSKAITNRWEYNFLCEFPYSVDLITRDIYVITLWFVMIWAVKFPSVEHFPTNGVCAVCYFLQDFFLLEIQTVFSLGNLLYGARALYALFTWLSNTIGNRCSLSAVVFMVCIS